MTREVPGHVHDFDLTKVSSAAVTYHLRPSEKARDGIPRHIGGWALATVNDATGELAIQSDWGNWSYRWHIDHMGETEVAPGPQWHVPMVMPTRKITLTEFIGERFRDSEYCDYLADKLTSRSERQVFDAQETVAAMRKYLIERRVEAVRSAIEYYVDEPPEERPDVLDELPHWADKVEVWIYSRSEKWPYDRAIVRRIYDELGEIDGEDNLNEFIRRFGDIEGHELVTTEPWDMAEHRPSHSYDQLLHGILPALVRACAARAQVPA